MLPRIAFVQTEVYQKLKAHFEVIQHASMKDMFAANPDRAKNLSLHFKNILFDFSKNRISSETIQLLCALARECALPAAIKSMFTGEVINEKENRAVLHTALRNMAGTPVYVHGKNVMPDVERVRAQMKNFCEQVINGAWKGFTGERITDVVNIGIGGSDLGPVMVKEALNYYRRPELNVHFVSNVDATHITETLKNLSPETTLFLIASKTFTTQETMTNAHTARNWFLQTAREEKYIAAHFIALSTAKKEVLQFGIAEENMFEFWDWVGGRFSLWSAIGLSIALAIGYQNFEELLWGAFEADQHFSNSEFERNIPVIMALLGIWNNNFFNAASHVVLPYDQYMHRFPAYLQQTDMESNGKFIDRNGQRVTYATGPIIWGEAGTNGQHAFYQLIHQGTQFIPCDFIVPANSLNETGDHHLKLLSHCFAQSEALMNGRSETEVRNELQTRGLSEGEMEKLIPFMIFTGNRPSNTFLLDKVTPRTLGSLIAMYEHKIFVQGVLWNIFSFDQWGVELGKKLAQKILPELTADHQITSHDSSTNQLIHSAKELRK